MTVQQLIEALQKYSGNLEVVAAFSPSSTGGDVEPVTRVFSSAYFENDWTRSQQQKQSKPIPCIRID